MHLGERIRAIREMVGLSGKRLDFLADLKPGHTWAIEKSGNVEADNVSKIASAFGVSTDCLIRGDSFPPSKDLVLASLEVARVKVEERAKGNADGSAGPEAA